MCLDCLSGVVKSQCCPQFCATESIFQSAEGSGRGIIAPFTSFYNASGTSNVCLVKDKRGAKK